jgi:poly(A) polymerase
MAEIIGFLSSRVAAGELYLVGGYLRDFLLGDPARDADFVLVKNPQKLVRETVSRFGGSHFLLHEESMTHRVMLGSEGKIYTLDFSRIKGVSLEEDLSQRDFTINAMALDLWNFYHQGEVRLPRDLVDKYYGWRDLNLGILRECHKETFLQDPLRLLRGFRFKHNLELEIEERTLNHMKKYAALLTRSPGERVAEELLETISHPGSSKIFADLEATGLMHFLTPSLNPLVGLEQNTYHHLDVWGHTLLTMDELDRLLEDPGRIYPEHAERIKEYMTATIQDHYTRSTFLRLGALYHDAGKTRAFSRDDSGRIHFYGHQDYGEEEVEKVALRLRLSRRGLEYLKKVVGKHMHIAFALAGGISRRAIVRLVQRLGAETPDLVLLSTADRMATRGEAATPEGLRRYIDFCRQVLDEFFERSFIPPLIKGDELMERLGLEEGKIVGELLNEIRLAQLVGKIGSTEEAVELARKLLKNKAGEERNSGEMG